MPFSGENPKIKRIQTLRYLVASRWVLHALIFSLGLVQKAMGIAEFYPWAFGLILVTYGYNFCCYWYLHRAPTKITAKGLAVVSLFPLIADQLIYTVLVYVTGGIESLAFLFYFITILMAVVALTELPIVALTLFSGILYLSVIVLEYVNILPHQPRYGFGLGYYHQLGATIDKGVTVGLILVFTAFFTAFINNLIRQRELAVTVERDKMIAIVNNLVDGIILLDRVGQLVLLNPYAQRLLQITEQQLPLTLSLMQPPPAVTGLQSLYDFIVSAAAAPVYQTTELTIGQQDERLVLQATALQVVNSHSQPIGALVILRNITREKDLDQIKSDFISVAAHQLRTPLSTLKWLFKLLIDGDAGSLTERQKELLTKGYYRNDEVIDIVNNLLDVSEIDDGRTPYKFTVGSVNDVLQQAIDIVQVNADRKEVKLKVETAAAIPPLKFDRQKIKMVFQNLLDNAIKYSNTKKIVTVTMVVAGDEVVCTVTDQGIGMSPDTISKLFTKFFRGKEATLKDPSGSGLGLYIVRSIVEKHGGSIECTSHLHEGTQFVVRLPVT